MYWNHMPWISLFFPHSLLALPRCYPAGFGHSLRRAWESHIGAVPARRELRFKPQSLPFETPLEQFGHLPLGDLWDDAKLWEPLAYLFRSKRLRWGDLSFGKCLETSHLVRIQLMEKIVHHVWLVMTERFWNWYSYTVIHHKWCRIFSINSSTFFPCRIPKEWQPTMYAFWDEYQQKATSQPLPVESWWHIFELSPSPPIHVAFSLQALCKAEVCEEINMALNPAESVGNDL